MNWNGGENSRVVTLIWDDIARKMPIEVEGSITMHKSMCWTLQYVATQGHQQGKQNEHRQKAGSGYQRDTQPIKNTAVEEILVHHGFSFENCVTITRGFSWTPPEDDSCLPEVQAAA